ncbi:hypothetical protein GCM10010249_57980 [Streptomyces roseolilacinus]|uniref:Uncharacterized protein n=1 Tax=Streptomyces roseolilacinus TaxID=66904 RepID=A0A918EMC6_9ACTN|nr:hypothetical protein GCM10010249_57980 [Streptomyces roseolilacinus]
MAVPVPGDGPAPGSAAGGGVTGATGGRWMWPVVSRAGGAAGGWCGAGQAGPDVCGTGGGACGGIGCRCGACPPGACGGGPCGAGACGGGPGWCACWGHPAAVFPGWWGGGSGAPTACCIRCHSVSYD